MNEHEEVGDSYLDSETVWKEGESGNPAGRPKGKKNSKPRSRMRTTLTKLYTLQEDSVEIIRKSLQPVVEGSEVVGKVQLDTAKFVIKAIESLNNTCLREEMAIMGVKLKDESVAAELAANQNAPQTSAADLGTFSMEMVENDIKH